MAKGMESMAVRSKCVIGGGIMILSYTHSCRFQMTLDSLFVMSGRLFMMAGSFLLMRMSGVMV